MFETGYIMIPRLHKYLSIRRKCNILYLSCKLSVNHFLEEVRVQKLNITMEQWIFLHFMAARRKGWIDTVQGKHIHTHTPSPAYTHVYTHILHASY